GKGNAHKRIVILAAGNPLPHFLSLVSGHGDAVSGVSNREVHAVHLAGMRHDVKSEIQSSSPDIFEFGVTQLGVNADHALTEKLGAFADRVFVFGEKCGASAKQHAP